MIVRRRKSPKRSGKDADDERKRTRSGRCGKTEWCEEAVWRHSLEEDVGRQARGSFARKQLSSVKIFNLV